MPLKTHKIALNPNNKQRVWFAQQCGYARFAYNHALSDFKAGLDNDEFLSTSKLNERFNVAKKEHGWTKEQDQVVANKSIFVNLSAAIAHWVSKRAKFPKYKKRGKRDSFTTNNQFVQVVGKRIKLPKIGGWVKMFQALRWSGKIMKVTISRTAHRWFVSITVDTEDTEAVANLATHPVIGIDVGINSLSTLSDGTKYDNPSPLKRYERKVAKEARRLSKRTNGSKNWIKQKWKVARIHYRIACIRNDAHHKAATDIVNKTSAIGIETLKIKNMLKNRKLAKALSDSALGGFLQKLKTKAARGIPVTEASQFYASSKTCSSCGHTKDNLVLSERTYHCGQCDVSIDRDVNAAINLRNVAVGHTETENACGVQVRPQSEAGETEARKAVWQQQLLPI